MKKAVKLVLFFLLCAVTTLSFAACEFSETTSSKIAFGETATLSSFEYTVTQTTENTSLSTPRMPTTTTYTEAGAKWFRVNVKVKNKDSYLGMVSYSNFELIVGTSNYKPDIGSHTWYVDGNGADSIAGKEKICYTNSSTTIEKNFSKELILFFKVPDDTQLAEVYLKISSLKMLLS